MFASDKHCIVGHKKHPPDLQKVMDHQVSQLKIARVKRVCCGVVLLFFICLYCLYLVQGELQYWARKISISLTSSTSTQ